MCPLKSTSATLEGVSSFAAPYLLTEGVVALSSLTAACSIYRLCIIERKSISIATAVVLCRSEDSNGSDSDPENGSENDDVSTCDVSVTEVERAGRRKQPTEGTRKHPGADG